MAHEDRAMKRCKFPGCNYQHKYLAVVKKHNRIHMSDPKLRFPFECSYCLHRLGTWELLKAHIKRRHTEEYPFKCQVPGCSYKAKFKHYVYIHEKSRHARPGSSKQTPCQVDGCNFKTKGQTLLKLHVRNCHSKNRKKTIACPMCPRKFFKSCQMENHLTAHTNEKPWKCSECSYESKSKGHLDRHRESFHGDLGESGDKRLRKCKICDFVTRFPDVFKTHVATHSDHRPFACDFPGCTFRSKWKPHLGLHEKRMHVPEQHPCPEPDCPFIAKHKQGLKKHMRAHEKKQFPCVFPECHRKFMTEVAMLNHQRLHDPSREYQCEYCHQRFSTKTSLGTHMRFMHLEEKHIQCPHCDYRTNQRSNLRSHLKRIHQAENVTCSRPGCSFKSCSPYDMMKHSERHNSKTHPFKCKYCAHPYGFTHIQSLHKHLRTKHPQRSSLSSSRRRIVSEFACKFCGIGSSGGTTCIWHFLHDKVPLIVLPRIKIQFEWQFLQCDGKINPQNLRYFMKFYSL